MGLSSIAAGFLLVAVVVVAATGMMLAYSGWAEANAALKEKERILEDKTRSSIRYGGFNSTNVSASAINVTLYMLNSGSSGMKADCTDLYVDGTWIPHGSLGSAVLPRGFGAGMWNPSETLLLSTSGAIVVGEHNATVVSCAGARADGRFNASKCGDMRCEGGEYCAGDNSACPDNVCYNPLCLNGCTQTPIVNDIDVGECDSNNHAGLCLSTPCQCGSTSVCCGLYFAACSGNANCCAGFECSGGKCKERGATTTTTVPSVTCSSYCVGLGGYTAGTCRGNAAQCTGNGETHQAGGDQYCTGGPSADTCCCRP